MSYLKINDRLTRLLIDANQAFESYEACERNLRNLKGSMNWIKVKGRDYLYRRYNDRKDAFIGVRSEKTEAIKDRFAKDVLEAKERKADVLDSIKLNAGLIKASNLNRFPYPAAKIIRALRKKGVDHKIIGTNALFAYETAAGVLFESSHIATEDIDILLDARQGLKIVANLDEDSLLTLIQKTDQSFQPISDSSFEFAAVNKDQYRVDFLTQGEGPMKPSLFDSLLDDEKLKPIQIDSLKWVLSAPKFESLVYDTKGMPLRINAIDPRAFVLHKWYVSQQPDRSPLKRDRDFSQASTVASLLAHELTYLADAKSIRKIFPIKVRDSAMNQIGDFDL